MNCADLASEAGLVDLKWGESLPRLEETQDSGVTGQRACNEGRPGSHCELTTNRANGASESENFTG